jgi:hypothetical protein
MQKILLINSVEIMLGALLVVSTTASILLFLRLLIANKI